MPIVAIIYIFEAIHTKIKGDTPLFSTLGPSGTTTLPLDGATSPRQQKPSLSNRAKTYSQRLPELPTADGMDSPGHQNLVVKGKKEGPVETVVVDNPALEQRVEDLTAKIAELTALIMSQQGVADSGE